MVAVLIFVNVSVLSVEPWLVELGHGHSRQPRIGQFQCSQSSRGWWNLTLHPPPPYYRGFQCSQSSRGWWNRSKMLGRPGDKEFQCSQSSRGWWNNPASAVRFPLPAVSVLSVEPWLVEHADARCGPAPGDVSVLSVEPWLVERLRLNTCKSMGIRFQCSQSSRGWWNRIAAEERLPRTRFQCSQSSRGWWNSRARQCTMIQNFVSVLSVEPWLVELRGVHPGRVAVTRFQCSQSSRGWWNSESC